jgi:hypothetical protein
LQQCQEVVNSRGLLPRQVLENGIFVDVDYTKTCRTRISVFDERKSSFANVAEAVLGTRHFRDMARFGTKLYSEEADTCPQTDSFSRTEALQFVTSCSEPFMMNQAVFGEGVAKNERGRFCVVPCPSFVYTDDEYRSMWGGYVCIGLLALALNFVAVCDLFTSKTYVSPGVYWILVLSVVHGILCMLPSVILFDSVACGDFGSEMRFGYL